MAIRVLIADDDALVRAGLSELFTADPDFEVVGEAANGEEAVSSAATMRPDVVLIEVRIPGIDGVAAAERILSTAPGRLPRIVILTTLGLDEDVYRSLAAGVAGFLLKDMPPERILAAVRTIAHGDAVHAPEVMRRLVEAYIQRHRFAAAGVRGVEGLSARESEILRLVAQGIDNPAIARLLALSEATVKTHLKNVMSKLRVNSRAQAVVAAYETGFVVPAGRPVAGAGG